MLNKFIANKKLLYSSVGVLFALVVLVFFFLGNGNGKEIVSAEVRNLSEIVQVSGTVEAESVANLGFQVSGTVSSVSVKTNQMVYQGQELLRLNLGTLPAELKSAQADLSITKAQNSNTQINLDTIKQKQDSLVASAYATLLSSNLESEPSDSDYSQTPPVISGRYYGPEGTYKLIISRGNQSDDALLSVFGAETVRDVDISKTSATKLGTRGLYVSFPDSISDYYETIWYVTIPNTKSSSYVANYNAYQEAIKERDRAIEEATENLRAQSVGSIAQAEITRAESAVEKIQAEISKHIIRSPFAGIVASLDIDPGEAVNAGTSVVTVISDSKLGIEIDLPEIDSIKVNVGNPVSITLDALGEEKFSGVVESVNRTETMVDGVAVYEARIIFDNPDPRIISGMTAEVSITTNKKESVISVPLRSVKQKSNGDFYVTTIDPSGKEKEAVVTVGLRSSDGYAEIISGLNENEKVVTDN